MGIMGSAGNYLEEGGFLEYLWEAEPETIGGVKVIYNPSKDNFDDLPIYSNTSKMYFKRDSEGEIIQLRIYDKRKAAFDIDINPKQKHVIKRRTGKVVLEEGVAHIHIWQENSKGEWIRGHNSTRYLNDEEISQYNDLLRKANPNVKFRP